MSWSERQRAMLLEMGLRVWPDSPAVDDAAAQAAPGAEPRSASRGQPEPGATVAPVAPVARSLVSSVGAPSPASPGDAAAMDWPALRTAVQGCRACALCEGRRNAVLGSGAASPRWLIVGEAPGEQEDARGLPFVGPSGDLLDAMLAALALQRDAGQVYITNTVKCRPPGNRNPQPDELAACAPFLQRQIELLKPRVILALGRVAAHALLGGAEPLGRLRGRVHVHRGLRVVVSYHPAYLLRHPIDKARAWEDLCLAASVAEGAHD